MAGPMYEVRTKTFDKLFFGSPVSLGDTFVYTGVVHYYADRTGELHLPIDPRFEATTRCLYQDYPNIIIAPLSGEDITGDSYVAAHPMSRVVRNSFESITVEGHRCHVNWDCEVYDWYELPYSTRYNNFRLPKFNQGSEDLYNQFVQNNEPYLLVHRSTSKNPVLPIDVWGMRRNFGLPDMKIIEVQEGQTDNMMDYVKLIQNASEIHCVASSFHCLVDSMHKHTNADLYFHNIRADNVMRVNAKWNDYRWMRIEYGVRV